MYKQWSSLCVHCPGGGLDGIATSVDCRLRHAASQSPLTSCSVLRRRRRDVGIGGRPTASHSPPAAQRDRRRRPRPRRRPVLCSVDIDVGRRAEAGALGRLARREPASARGAGGVPEARGADAASAHAGRARRQQDRQVLADRVPRAVHHLQRRLLGLLPRRKDLLLSFAVTVFMYTRVHKRRLT